MTNIPEAGAVEVIKSATNRILFDYFKSKYHAVHAQLLPHIESGY
jgi:hypothetical protein